MSQRNWKLAVELRGKYFVKNLATYKMMTKLKPKVKIQGKSHVGDRFAVMHIGAPACGMNAAVRSFVRNCLSGGYVPMGIHDGIEGFVNGNVEELTWSSVNG